MPCVFSLLKRRGKPPPGNCGKLLSLHHYLTYTQHHDTAFPAAGLAHRLRRPVLPRRSRRCRRHGRRHTLLRGVPGRRFSRRHAQPPVPLHQPRPGRRPCGRHRVRERRHVLRAHCLPALGKRRRADSARRLPRRIPRNPLQAFARQGAHRHDTHPRLQPHHGRRPVNKLPRHHRARARGERHNR